MLIWNTLKASHTTLAFCYAQGRSTGFVPATALRQVGSHLGYEAAAGARGGGGGIQATRGARPLRSRTPRSPPAAWAGLARLWKITAVALKGAHSFPARSSCASRPIKLECEAQSPFYLRRENKIQFEVISQGRTAL